jgi:hypothetical protein
LFIANAHSVQQRLRDVHDELRKELEGVHRLAVAIYDAESDELKTSCTVPMGFLLSAT